MIDSRIGTIAEHHGYARQRDKAIEELAELIRALSRVSEGFTKAEDLDNLIEELADAKIMIDQMVYLTYSEIDVSEKIEEKIRRQLERDGLGSTAGKVGPVSQGDA